MCVTAAMGQDLRRRLHLRGAGADKITICYDLPNSSFCRLSQDARYLVIFMNYECGFYDFKLLLEFEGYQS